MEGVGTSQKGKARATTFKPGLGLMIVGGMDVVYIHC